MLKKLAMLVNCELKTAEDYIDQAYTIHEKSPQTADLLISIAEDHLTHCEKIFREGKRLIDGDKIYKYDDKMISMPTKDDISWQDQCKIIWDWQHGVAMEYIARYRYKLSKYKTM